jgi:hypothetical protein
MGKGNRRSLPLGPLLTSYRRWTSADLTIPEGFRLAGWLTPAFLDEADDTTLAAELAAFYTATHTTPFHPPTADRRVRFVRHALNHLLRGQDPLPDRLARCATPGEAYFVPGLGLTLWTALVKSLDPLGLPFWCPATDAGLVRLGLVSDSPTPIGPRFGAVVRGYDIIRTADADLSADRIDDFLERIGRMTGRELPADPATDAAAWGWQAEPDRIRRAVREVRTRTPLRLRIREASGTVADALRAFQGAAKAGAFVAAWEAFRSAFPDLRWEHALPRLDDAYSPVLEPADRARLWCETAAVLRERYRIHPLELADVLVAIAAEEPNTPSDGAFGGFCSDSFRFLGELTGATSREWMAPRRDRYQFVLRGPLIELCEAVAARYVGPVLAGEYGWDLETDTRPGRALTSIVKNDFGRSSPYQPVQWLTFYRRSQANKRADAQFFVRVAADGIGYGFHLGRTARDAGRQFRRNVQEHAEPIFAALAAGGVFDECRFWTVDDLTGEVPIKSPADLRQWAVNKTLAVGKRLPADAALLRTDELVGDILLTFDRLVPAFACAAEPDPRPLLARRAGSPDGRPPFDTAAFVRETFLPESWLDRVLGLLRLKKQLILQGVPGTGKTHVARCLARLLTRDRPDCVRLVQFHPAYSYEEFVEGIKARGVETNGRTEVTYPVEPGVLCDFAAQAAKHPSEPHALVIDEFNRGNLPRIFGELLYLLEYRGQAVTLPYSKRQFRLPDNLFLVATMNTVDRSAVALDQALRRRFSFVEMAPDAALLAGWLEKNPPAESDGTFGPRVVRVFDELNRRLACELGPDRQVGHSFFMVPDLDAASLAAVWEHHVRPLLLDYFGGREDRLSGYTPEKLAGDRPRPKARRKTPVDG